MSCDQLPPIAAGVHVDSPFYAGDTMADSGVTSGGATSAESNVTSTTSGASSATFECDVCQRQFASKKYLSMHMALHKMAANMVTSNATRRLEPEEEMSSSQLLPVPATSTSPPPRFSASRHGDHHAPWACPVCEKTFAQNSNFRNHVRTHTDDRPYVCLVCYIGFKERYHLKKHALFKHSGELREQCRQCGKRFKDLTAVRAHERTHSNLRPYVCARCRKTFKTSECLWHHENRSKTCGRHTAAPAATSAEVDAGSGFLPRRTRRRNLLKSSQQMANEKQNANGSDVIGECIILTGAATPQASTMLQRHNPGHHQHHHHHHQQQQQQQRHQQQEHVIFEPEVERVHVVSSISTQDTYDLNSIGGDSGGSLDALMRSPEVDLLLPQVVDDTSSYYDAIDTTAASCKYAEIGDSCEMFVNDFRFESTRSLPVVTSSHDVIEELFCPVTVPPSSGVRYSSMNGCRYQQLQQQLNHHQAELVSGSGRRPVEHHAPMNTASGSNWLPTAIVTPIQRQNSEDHQQQRQRNSDYLKQDIVKSSSSAAAVAPTSNAPSSNKFLLPPFETFIPPRQSCNPHPGTPLCGAAAPARPQQQCPTVARYLLQAPASQ